MNSFQLSVARDVMQTVAQLNTTARKFNLAKLQDKRQQETLCSNFFPFVNGEDLEDYRAGLK